MKSFLASPAAKLLATGLASVLMASPTIPQLAAFSAFLVPLGSFILGSYHVTIPPAAKAAT